MKVALIVIWETADRICGKRLKAAIPLLIKAMEKHGHLELDPEVRTKLIAVSAATIDRMLAPVRKGAGVRRKRRLAKKLTKLIRDEFPKVKSQIQGDAVRVSGKNKDDLQRVIARLRDLDFDVPLQFQNYR